MLYICLQQAFSHLVNFILWEPQKTEENGPMIRSSSETGDDTEGLGCSATQEQSTLCRKDSGLREPHGGDPAPAILQAHSPTQFSGSFWKVLQYTHDYRARFIKILSSSLGSLQFAKLSLG